MHEFGTIEQEICKLHWVREKWKNRATPQPTRQDPNAWRKYDNTESAWADDVKIAEAETVIRQTLPDTRRLLDYIKPMPKKQRDKYESWATWNMSKHATGSPGNFTMSMRGYANLYRLLMRFPDVELRHSGQSKPSIEWVCEWKRSSERGLDRWNQRHPILENPIHFDHTRELYSGNFRLVVTEPYGLRVNGTWDDNVTDVYTAFAEKHDLAIVILDPAGSPYYPDRTFPILIFKKKWLPIYHGRVATDVEINF